MFGEIVSVSIKASLLQLAVRLQSFNVPLVSNLGTRLITWLDGNDRGQFLLDNYQDYGFYYLTVTGGQTNPNNGKTTLSYTLKNLFTDQQVFSGSELFNLGQNIETQNYVNAGFQQFQIPPNVQGNKMGAFDPRLVGQNDYKIIMVKPGSQFTQTINPGTGGGGINPGTGGGGVIPSGTQTTGHSSTNVTPGGSGAAAAGNLISSITDNPMLMYAAIGGLALYFLSKK